MVHGFHLAGREPAQVQVLVAQTKAVQLADGVAQGLAVVGVIELIQTIGKLAQLLGPEVLPALGGAGLCWSLGKGTRPMPLDLGAGPILSSRIPGLLRTRIELGSRQLFLELLGQPAEQFHLLLGHLSGSVEQPGQFAWVVPILLDQFASSGSCRSNRRNLSSSSGLTLNFLSRFLLPSILAARE